MSNWVFESTQNALCSQLCSGHQQEWLGGMGSGAPVLLCFSLPATSPAFLLHWDGEDAQGRGGG